jgi:hypothetical protein
MSTLGDFFKGVAEETLKDLLNKTTRKVSRRKRRRTSSTGTAATLRKIEKLLNPAKKQTSRKATSRARSKVKRRSY